MLKGPSGVLLGQSAMGGLVSVITKQPTDTFEGSVALKGGSFDRKMATLDIGGPISQSGRPSPDRRNRTLRPRS